MFFTPYCDMVYSPADHAKRDIHEIARLLDMVERDTNDIRNKVANAHDSLCAGNYSEAVAMLALAQLAIDRVPVDPCGLMPHPLAVAKTQMQSGVRWIGRAQEAIA